MVASILIIEDNPANLELMSYLLSTSGYKLLFARDGEAGLKIARAELPDLIICDIQMPGMDGYAFAQHAKGNPTLRDIPLIAVTAYAMVGDREKVQAAGFDGYLAKPINPRTFVQEVGTFLAADLRSVAQEKATETTQSPAKSGRNGRMILVVDDLKADLDLACSIFEYAGYTAIPTRDATRALALARQAPPDLILSDVCMPQGSGYDFIKEVKADPSLRQIPFVFMTSTAISEKERAQGLALGAAKYLLRPLEPQVLLKEIEDCLQEKQGR